MVTGVIRGTDPAAGEIVYSCHLCHQKPGANDNASGAATILEDARVLARLIREGKLPRPARTIRFLWPPEVTGTACYFARHPEIVRGMRAAIHMDMVGGDFEKTKAVFHITHTPASLPSAVNDVAAVFGEYVIAGSKRAAAIGDFTDALLSPEGGKQALVADLAPFSMGSDHDVYQEGSFRVPAIYLNDWPDVFIHTNNDTPENIDPTKLRRVAVIGAASGYFLATIGPAEARKLALEVFARGAARQGEALEQALRRADDPRTSAAQFADAQNLVEEAGRQERESLASVKAFAPADGGVSELLDDLTANVRARTAADLGLVQRVVPVPATAVPVDPVASRVPVRNPAVVGNLQVYYYDYLADHLGAPVPGDEKIQYEILNLVDGHRSVREIRNVLDAAYGSGERRGCGGLSEGAGEGGGGDGARGRSAELEFTAPASPALTSSEAGPPGQPLGGAGGGRRRRFQECLPQGVLVDLPVFHDDHEVLRRIVDQLDVRDRVAVHEQ